MSATIIPFPSRQVVAREADTALDLMDQLAKRMTPGNRDALKAATEYVATERQLGKLRSLTKGELSARIEILAKKYCAMDLGSMQSMIKERPEWAGVPCP